jgi:hypothetical protein
LRYWHIVQLKLRPAVSAYSDLVGVCVHLTAFDYGRADGERIQPFNPVHQTKAY